jgi:hypothetical protein
MIRLHYFASESGNKYPQNVSLKSCGLCDDGEQLTTICRKSGVIPLLNCRRQLLRSASRACRAAVFYAAASPIYGLDCDARL